MYRLLTINRSQMSNRIVSSSLNQGGTIKHTTIGSSYVKVFCQLLQYHEPVILNHYLNLKGGQSFHLLEKNQRSSSMPNVLIRNQSSTTPINAELLENRRKYRKPRYAKYVELLEVTELSAKEKKSRVKRLNAKKFQEFMNNSSKITNSYKTNKNLDEISPNDNTMNSSSMKFDGISLKQQPVEYQKINLDAFDATILESGLYDDKPILFFGDKINNINQRYDTDQIEHILKSFNNYRDILETMQHEKHDVDSESFSLNPAKISETEVVNDPLDTLEPYISPDIIESTTKKRKSSATTVKTKQRFKSKTHNNEEQERLAKEKALRINLNTYLNICVTAGLLNRGLSTLLAYRMRSKKHPLKENLVTIHMYNILLHGFAEKGEYDRFHEIFHLMEEDGVQINEQTYAAIFECLGRLEPTEDNIEEIRKFIENIDAKGFSLNQIIDRSKFLSDQRDIALDAIRRVKPDFEPVYTPPIIDYNNPLLNELNKFTQPNHIKAKDCKNVNGSEIMNSKKGYSKQQLEELAKKQLKIELAGSITIKSIEKPKEFSNAQFCREKLKEHESLWRHQINSAIERDMNTLKAQIRFKPNGYMNYYTYLRTLNPSTYTEILMKEIYKLAEGSESYSPTVGQLYKELGQKVQQRYLIEQKKKNGILEKLGQVYHDYCELWNNCDSSDNTRQMWQRLVHEHRINGPSMDIKEVNWPSNVLTGVGRFLYNVLMRDIKIDAFCMRQKTKSKQRNYLPAFYTLFRNQGRLVKEEVKPHPVLSRLFRASRQQTLTFESNLIPMLCPPQPWSTPHNGGYLLNRADLIRLPQQAVQQWERINSSSSQNIYPALDSLNQLASIPWRVNNDILDVIIEVFQNGGDHKLDVPQPPSSLPPLPTTPIKDNNISNAERAKQFREQLSHRRKQAEMYSLWCDTLYRLSLANHYRGKVFWLPHNMDFRGRVYPIPPHLNHLGSDLARSILIFDQPQPLGVDGFSWLKLHCINLTGLKKRDSIQERLLYAEQVLPEILDSADNPLNGRMWWTKSDEPWQTLSCCIEIAKVHRSPNPEEYMSRFPIHQDGSCNGLQHYAALGRDKSGAISVNLTPRPTPQDVYSAVASLVEKSRENDAKNGLHVAEALKGFVRRKVIKQTVMTTVYGVTRYGARLQIARQLKDIDDFPKDWVWPASTYLTTKTFESLREMFTSTREIQDWFTECARLISGVCGQNVEWITPLGLPVVQPYNRQEFKHITRSGIRVVETMSMDMFERPNVMKQKNAFPPNFIHSLDSSHMMLTSLHCERKGLTFVSVHDCFWTHASTVPDLNKICREQFVALHSQPILEDLSKFMKQKYSFNESDFSNDGSIDDLSKKQLNRILGQMPQKGKFDLNKVLESIYFFS